MKKHFTVIGNTDGNAFNKTLTEYCKEGYEPHGSLIAIPTGHGDKTFLTQMLVKELQK